MDSIYLNFILMLYFYSCLSISSNMIIIKYLLLDQEVFLSRNQIDKVFHNELNIIVILIIEDSFTSINFEIIKIASI